MGPTRLKSHSTGDRAVAVTEEFLDAAGCVVNTLEKRDYGFDLHVQLPESVRVDGDESWTMSPYTINVQVKGGAYVDPGVRLDVERWKWLLASPSPIYLAAVPESEPRWIAAVEELWPRGLPELNHASAAARPERASWDAASFVTEALLGVKLATPRMRAWWRAMQPVFGYEEQAVDGLYLLRYLLDLAVLEQISGPAMDAYDYERCASRAMELASSHHRLWSALLDLNLVRDGPGGPECSLDLEIYVPEGDLVLADGTVTDAAFAGRNHIVSASGELALAHLALPTIEAFLASLDEAS